MALAKNYVVDTLRIRSSQDVVEKNVAAFSVAGGAVIQKGLKIGFTENTTPGNIRYNRTAGKYQGFVEGPNIWVNFNGIEINTGIGGCSDPITGSVAIFDGSGTLHNTNVYVDTCSSIIAGGSYRGGTDSNQELFIFGATGTTLVAVSENKLYFDKEKAAFRVGVVDGTYWEGNLVGTGSFASGYDTVASGTYSSSFGFQTLASADNSFAEGDRTQAIGISSHAEGFQTQATGHSSHAEGNQTIASGLISHAEGNITTSNGQYSHSEGSLSIASGSASHAEGEQTTASGQGSHSEGNLTVASGNRSHAEGSATTASGTNSHAEGASTQATNTSSHAEGFQTLASGDRSHAEGSQTIASGDISHAEGTTTIASNTNSHAEGNTTTASGQNSHAEGNTTTASGNNSHAEGFQTLASGDRSHAEGSQTVASGDISHAEGFTTTASGSYSHTEGNLTIASGIASHAQNFQTTASGNYSFAGGNKAIATHARSFVWGGNTAGNDTNSVEAGGGIFGGSLYVVETGWFQSDVQINAGSVTNSFIMPKTRGDTAAYIISDGSSGTTSWKNGDAYGNLQYYNVYPHLTLTYTAGTDPIILSDGVINSPFSDHYFSKINTNKQLQYDGPGTINAKVDTSVTIGHIGSNFPTFNMAVFLYKNDSIINESRSIQTIFGPTGGFPADFNTGSTGPYDVGPVYTFTITSTFFMQFSTNDYVDFRGIVTNYDYNSSPTLTPSLIKSSLNITEV